MAPPALQTWYLPPSVAARRSLGEDFAEPLEVTTVLVRETVHALDAASPCLAALSIETIVAAVDAAIGCLQSDIDPGRLTLLELGPSLTGYSRQALRYALDVMLPRFRAEGLRLLLADELVQPAALDGFVRVGDSGGTLRMAKGPGRQFLLLADGVPTVGIFSLICALLLKSPALAKPAAGGALFPSVFARTLARMEPRLAEALAVIGWPGGSRSLEDAAIAGAGAVVACGSDSTIAAIRARTPESVRFIGYGHKLSLAAVTKECLTTAAAPDIARKLAWDVALFDQHGCLSPQFAVVEAGGDVAPEEFAALVAAELDVLNAELPRGRLSAERMAEIQSLREQAHFQSAIGHAVRVWQSAGSTSWTVVYRRRAEACTGRDRVLTAVEVKDLAAELPLICKGLPVSTIGVAASPERLRAIAPLLGTIASRICPLGTMGEPPITWRHDGLPNLAPLVTWVDQELP